MKPDEALVIIPSYPSPPMKRLTEHAKEKLGSRCLILDRTGHSVEWLEKSSEPIRYFVEDN